MGQQRRQNIFQPGTVRQRTQLRQTFGAAALPIRGKRIEHLAATQGSLGTLVTQDQRITLHCMHRCVEQQLRKHPSTGRQAGAFQQGDAPGHVLGAEVHVHRLKVFESPGFAGQQLHVDVQAPGGRIQAFGE
ncbi:hypothetical protein D3C75_518540 [compost metagenome]